MDVAEAIPRAQVEVDVVAIEVQAHLGDMGRQKDGGGHQVGCRTQGPT